MTEKLNSPERLTALALAQIILAICMISPAVGQWRPLPGPEGASIKVLFSHGDYLFAGTSNGAFRSTDQGQSWKSVNIGETRTHITSFTAIGGTLFAGSGDGYIFRS